MLRKIKNGRPPLAQEKIDEIQRLVRDGYSQNSIAEHLGVAKLTVRKYRILMNEK
ncbi:MULTISPECIES: helix-turn-helix domain-containing protein [Vibrio]|uniref:helix-turn-helix domain-containing protein n=1 Tax=Vibrio TaxID=662 RepID=UPI0012FFFBD6|nr:MULTISPECIES: helix-turn-helix domain-containing protein [Vibrio]